MVTMATRLLVLEDDDGIRSSLALALEDEGYEVVEHADAEEALRTVDDEQVDLMLVDLMLGGMDGFTFIRRTPRDAGPPHRRQRPRRHPRHRLPALGRGRGLRPQTP